MLINLNVQQNENERKINVKQKKKNNWKTHTAEHCDMKGFQLAQLCQSKMILKQQDKHATYLSELSQAQTKDKGENNFMTHESISTQLIFTFFSIDNIYIYIHILYLRLV